MPTDPPADERVTKTGIRGPYRWLTITGDVYMRSVIDVLPGVVLHRYLAVTSYDSGIRRLSDQEVAAGWNMRGNIAYSPRVETVDDLKFQRDGADAPGYDEWYIFDVPAPNLGEVYRGNYFEFDPRSGQLMVFVNSPAFLLHDPEPYMPGIIDIFWRQFLRIEPQAFIADGQDCLTLVSKDAALIRAAEQRLKQRK